MKDRDCESCKKFSRIDPLESEGYCDAKRIWVDPNEGEDCKMHEFTLHSANKYKDGTPIYTDTDSIRKAARNAAYGKSVEMSNQLDSLEQRVDELSEEYDAVLKTHGDTLEQHMERIEDLDDVLATHAGKINNHTDALLEHEHKLLTLSEDVSIKESNIEDLDFRLEEVERKVNSILKLLTHYDITPFAHIESNFCGNCSHISLKDGIAACDFIGEIVDPDSASCSMFEPPF